MKQKWKAIIDVKKEDANFPKTFKELSIMIERYIRREKLSKIDGSNGCKGKS